MSKYNIGGVVVEMEPKFDKLRIQSLPYRIYDDAQPDIQIAFSDRFLIEKQKEHPTLSIEECEYVWYGFDYYRKMPEFGGIMVHSSCIAVDGNAYLFSASSGTGKSTHTELWKKKFGEDAVYVNDDKPLIRRYGDAFCACGTPFSGKTDLNNNVVVPLKAMCILERGLTNEIRRATTTQSVAKLLEQMYRPFETTLMAATMAIFTDLLNQIPVYVLSCNMEPEAADVAYDFMSKPAFKIKLIE